MAKVITKLKYLYDFEDLFRNTLKIAQTDLYITINNPAPLFSLTTAVGGLL